MSRNDAKRQYRANLHSSQHSLPPPPTHPLPLDFFQQSINVKKRCDGVCIHTLSKNTLLRTETNTTLIDSTAATIGSPSTHCHGSPSNKEKNNDLGGSELIVTYPSQDAEIQESEITPSQPQRATYLKSGSSQTLNQKIVQSGKRIDICAKNDIKRHSHHHKLHQHFEDCGTNFDTDNDYPSQKLMQRFRQNTFSSLPTSPQDRNGRSRSVSRSFLRYHTTGNPEKPANCNPNAEKHSSISKSQRTIPIDLLAIKKHQEKVKVTTKKSPPAPMSPDDDLPLKEPSQEPLERSDSSSMTTESAAKYSERRVLMVQVTPKDHHDDDDNKSCNQTRRQPVNKSSTSSQAISFPQLLSNRGHSSTERTVPNSVALPVSRPNTSPRFLKESSLRRSFSASGTQRRRRYDVPIECIQHLKEIHTLLKKKVSSSSPSPVPTTTQVTSLEKTCPSSNDRSIQNSIFPTTTTTTTDLKIELEALRSAKNRIMEENVTLQSQLFANSRRIELLEAHLNRDEMIVSNQTKRIITASHEIKELLYLLSKKCLSHWIFNALSKIHEILELGNSEDPSNKKWNSTASFAGSNMDDCPNHHIDETTISTYPLVESNHHPAIMRTDYLDQSCTSSRLVEISKQRHHSDRPPLQSPQQVAGAAGAVKVAKTPPAPSLSALITDVPNISASTTTYESISPFLQIRHQAESSSIQSQSNDSEKSSKKKFASHVKKTIDGQQPYSDDESDSDGTDYYFTSTVAAPNQTKMKFAIPPLGLQEKNVGFGSWLSGEATQGETYTSN